MRAGGALSNGIASARLPPLRRVPLFDWVGCRDAQRQGVCGWNWGIGARHSWVYKGTVSVMSAESQLPIIAIVGRPNVGKSALFNRIVGRRVAIVHEQAGVTRDRVSGRACWRDKVFEVVDTGGIAFMDDEKSADELAAATRRQAEIAVAMARAIIFLTDVQDGVTPLDMEIAGKLRASGKPVFLAVNKVDDPGREPLTAEFARLGFAPLYPVSALHGHGVAELLDAATADLPAGAVQAVERPLRIAIVGRPNVGKSSLLNAILQTDRTIVSAIPGTTRDAVDVPYVYRTAAGEKQVVLVDTAGLRHRSKIRSAVDQFGLMRAERSIRECDLAVLVLDAAAGVTMQDKKIGGKILEAGRACVIVVNKWDLATAQQAATRLRPRASGAASRQSFQAEYVRAVRRELFFLDWAPLLFTSAKTGAGVAELFPLISRIEQEASRAVPTPELNQLVGRALSAYPPPRVHGQRLKVYYAFRKPGLPPTLVLFVNNTACLTPHYRRFLTDKIRSVWSFRGWPILLECRPRPRRAYGKKQRAKG